MIYCFYFILKRGNLMKKVLCAILASFTALAMCACQGGNVSKTSTTSQSSTPQSGLSQSSLSKIISDSSTEKSEASSETPTEQQKKTVNDYVYTEVEKSLPGTSKFLITCEEYSGEENKPNRIPQVKLLSSAAQTVNAEIMNKYSKFLEDNEEAVAGGHPIGRIDYAAYLNGNILSLAIESRSTDTPNSHFSVYNFDVTTGETLSRSQLLSVANAAEQDILDMVKDEINAIYDDMASKATGNYVKIVEDARNSSLSEENLSKVEYYYNADGDVTAAFRYTGVAGAADYGEISVLDAAMDFTAR